MNNTIKRPTPIGSGAIDPKQVQQLIKINEGLGKENGSLKDENEVLRKTIASLTSENQTLKTQRDGLLEESKKLNNDNVVLSNDLKVKEQTIQNLKEENQSLINSNDRLSVSFSSACDDRDEAIFTLRDIKNRLIKLFESKSE